MVPLLRHLRGVLVVAAALVGAGVCAKEVQLTGPQIRAAISGKYVTDEHHWGHKYFTDGRVERWEGRRRGSGHWSVKGDRLCLRWPEIGRDEPPCYRVVREGVELQYRDERSVAYRGLIRPLPKSE